MRQRRHVNGNSNALTSAVDSPGWGSGRTVPANITSTLKRVAPSAAAVDAEVVSNTVKQEKRSGAATARRPQSSRLPGSRDTLAECRPKRRVQSARGASDKWNQSSDVAGEATLDTVLQPIGDTTYILPKLQTQIDDLAGQPKSKSRPPGLQRMAAPPTSSVFASGTDANSQVQWAVKVAPVAPAGQVAGLSEPVEIKDLRRLLRDRYGEKRSVRQAFLAWDTNKDGRLCVEELRDMLTQLGLTQALGQKKVDTILQHVHAMPAASLHYNDFCKFVYGPSGLNQSASSNIYTTRSSSLNSQVTRHARPEDDVVAAADPTCVVSLLRTKYESRRVHQVFRDWDIDKNGGVTMAEIESNLRRQGLRIAKPQLMKLFDTYDLNHDGRLLYNEFMRLVYGPVHEQRYSFLAEQRRTKQHEQQIHERDPLAFFRDSVVHVPQQSSHSADDPDFKATLQCKLKAFASRLNDAYAAFDDDHNGNLSYRELSHGLRELGLNLTEPEILHLATRVDIDGNGEISFKEFCDVFGGDEVPNRRRRSAPSGDEEDTLVEEQNARDQQTKDSSRQSRAAGTFSFSHLTKRTKIPTRCGRTPYASTKGIISNQDDRTNPAQFMTEAQLYGSGSSSQPAPAPTVITTLGQEEKQRRDAANACRLQRLRVQIERNEAQARPLQECYYVAQERRVRTLQRHQEGYHQRIEELRPRYAVSPARKGIQISRASSTAPLY